MLVLEAETLWHAKIQTLHVRGFKVHECVYICTLSVHIHKVNKNKPTTNTHVHHLYMYVCTYTYTHIHTYTYIYTYRPKRLPEAHTLSIKPKRSQDTHYPNP